MEKHIEDNIQKHLALMASASMKLSQEFEEKLQEQQDEFQGYLEQKDRWIEETPQEEKDKVLNENKFYRSNKIMKNESNQSSSREKKSNNIKRNCSK